MKKSLIALSVAAGMVAAAQANTTTLYGSLGYSIQVAKTNTIKDATNLSKTVWDLNTAAAKFGIKGTEDLSNGLQAFFKFEFGFDDGGTLGKGGITKTGTAYLGFKGDFGTFTIGKQNTVWKLATNFNDNFNEIGYKGKSGAITKASKAISYVSPGFSGFNIGAAIIMDGELNYSKGVDAFDIGVLYNNNGVSAGLDYMQLQSKPKTRYYGGHIGYKNDQFKVGFGAQKQKDVGNYFNLGGEYYSGANTFRAGFDLIDVDGAKNDYNFALGYQYNFSERTYTWVEAEYFKKGAAGAKNDFQTVVGVRHDF